MIPPLNIRYKSDCYGSEHTRYTRIESDDCLYLYNLWGFRFVFFYLVTLSSSWDCKTACSIKWPWLSAQYKTNVLWNIFSEWKQKILTNCRYGGGGGVVREPQVLRRNIHTFDFNFSFFLLISNLNSSVTSYGTRFSRTEQPNGDWTV